MRALDRAALRDPGRPARSEPQIAGPGFADAAFGSDFRHANNYEATICTKWQ